MCTVTFLPRPTGYALAMNRDEKRARPPGLPPARKTIAGCVVVYPFEPGGGTWVALNERGATLALINWYAVSARVQDDPVSRGVIIPALSTAATPAMVGSGLARLPLERINPFRLVGVFPFSRRVIEWRWDLKQRTRRQHRWRAQQWISSGFDEPGAQEVRGGVFRQALTQASAGTLDWLRRLHRSHMPEAGPFSTCMHRADAVTVSYTEISVVGLRAGIRSISGAPCEREATASQALQLCPRAGCASVETHVTPGRV